MIDPGLYLAFVLAVTLLILLPGPNVALIVANSVAYGPRFGLVTVAGTSAAVVVQLTLTALGMTAVLGALADWFEWLRWFGVAYLAVLGVQSWRAPVLDLSLIRPEPKSSRAIFLRGLLVSLTNPKTLLFYGALFPQFVVMNDHVAQQVALLSVTYLVIAIVLDCGWAAAAGRARFMLSRYGRLRNRITGSLLLGAGVGLALARRS